MKKIQKRNAFTPTSTAPGILPQLREKPGEYSRLARRQKKRPLKNNWSWRAAQGTKKMT